MSQLVIRIIVLLSLSMILIRLDAQSSPVDTDEVIIYTKDIGPSREWIRYTATSNQVYSIPTDKCSSLSPSGVYIAQTSLDTQNNDLVIIQLDTQATIVQSSWDTGWEPCGQFWINDEAIGIQKKDNIDEFFAFDLVNGSLVSASYPSVPPQYPPLPDWISNIAENYILPSPDENIYLYERCTGQVLTPDGNHCQIPTDFVIYNDAQASVVHLLENPSPDLIRGNDSLGNRIYSEGAKWSPLGQHLAFIRYRDCAFCFFDLSIYSLSSQQYLNTDWLNAELDYVKPLKWSPNSQFVAMWIVGRLEEEVQVGDDPFTRRTLVFYDVTTESYTITDQSFDIERFGNTGFWSPSSDGYIFTDIYGTLFHVDVSTGQSTQIDNNVVRLVAWRLDNLPHQNCNLDPNYSASITNYTLVNADTDQDIRTLDHTITETIDFSAIGTQNINIRANTNPATVGSVVFGLDGDPSYRTENGAPYALASNINADYLPWTPSIGTHTLTATPYSGPDGTGTACTLLTLNFDVIDSGASSNLITNINANSLDPNDVYEVDMLAVGEEVFIDTTFTFLSAPSTLLGQEFIRTANDDKEAPAGDFLSFTLTADATVYILFDARHSIPQWMVNEGWVDTGLIVDATDAQASGHQERNVYSKTFSAGLVTLGASEAGFFSTMYSVVAVPASAPTPLITTVSANSLDPNDMYTTSTLQVGTDVFIDRNYTWLSAPSSLLSQEFIQTALDDKEAPAGDFLTFTLTADATVYVLFDSRHSIPQWMVNEGWVDTGLLADATDGQSSGHQERNIYSRAFSAGQVTLGASEAGFFSVMYSVVAIPSTPSGPLITNVSANSVTPTDVYEIDTLAVGEEVFIDRNYTWLSMPPNLLGQDFIRAANDDKVAPAGDFLSFTLTADATVYILFDTRHSIPQWMVNESWVDTGLLADATDGQSSGHQERRVYTKTFSAGQVTLGASEAGASSVMYTVVAVPQ